MQELLDEVVERLIAVYPDARREPTVEMLEDLLEQVGAEGIEPKVLRRRTRAWLVAFPLNREEWPSSEAALLALFHDLLIHGLNAQKTKVRFRDRLRQRLGWVFEHYVAAAGLAVASASALYGLAYARFYSELNTSPGRVGVSTSDILANSATGGFALACLISLLLFLSFLPYAPILVESEAEGGQASWKSFAGFFAMSLLALLGLVSLATEVELPPFWTAGLLGGFAVAFKEGFTFNQIGTWPPISPKSMSFVFDRFLVLAVIVIPIAIVTTGIVTVIEAGALGAQARDGEAVRDPEILQMPFLGVRAEPATIALSDPTLRDPSVPHCALYLGTANGQIILYEAGPASTIQVPSGDVHLELRHRRSRCHPLHPRPRVTTP